MIGQLLHNSCVKKPIEATVTGLVHGKHGHVLVQAFHCLAAVA